MKKEERRGKREEGREKDEQTREKRGNKERGIRDEG
jgi:hypothetical protein